MGAVPLNLTKPASLNRRMSPVSSEDLGCGAWGDPDEIGERGLGVGDEGGELCGCVPVLLDDIGEHRDPVIDQPQTQEHGWVGDSGRVQRLEGVDAGADGLHRRQLVAERFGEVVDESVELAEELDTDLRQ
jgi:hypothetical protein